MTTTGGQQILQGLREARDFLKQVALLVQTAEDLLRQAGWECSHRNKCVDRGDHLYQPDRWIPTEVYRFYAPAEDDDTASVRTLAFVGVLLDAEVSWGGFVEPWVTAGIYSFAEDIDTRGFRYGEWVWGHVDEEHEPDGYVHECRFSDEEQEEYGGLTYQALVALPLVAIRDADGLKARLIDPLLERLKAHCGEES